MAQRKQQFISFARAWLLHPVDYLKMLALCASCRKYKSYKKLRVLFLIVYSHLSYMHRRKVESQLNPIF